MLAARRFLYIIAGLIMLTLAAAIGWNIFQDQLMRVAFVPGGPFKLPPPNTEPDYSKPGAWMSQPGIVHDPSRWTPKGFAPGAQPKVAVFYIHPTTYLGRDRWNAPIDDTESNERQRLFTMSQAGAFNNVGLVWAPRYRQAVMGSFLQTREVNEDAEKAIAFAYTDVERAFDAFLAAIPKSQPILLIGHSQGALHLMHLMTRRVAGTPVAKRIVAAYIVGWPISIAHDLPALGLPACEAPGEANCILSWQSFAEPADPHQILELYDRSAGFDGKPRRGSPMLCVNPLTGAPNSAALPSANRGSLIPTQDLSSGTIERGKIGARCVGQGWLSIGLPPEGYGAYVLPGNNYHVFDYGMFWANIRADAEARTRSFFGK
jgi:pimeloyl-ACP methyl ester carboxylesterase